MSSETRTAMLVSRRTSARTGARESRYGRTRRMSPSCAGASSAGASRISSIPFTVRFYWPLRQLESRLRAGAGGSRAAMSGLPALAGRRVGLRDVLAGTPEHDRIFFTGLWFRGHNNPRYAEL